MIGRQYRGFSAPSQAGRLDVFLNRDSSGIFCTPSRRYSGLMTPIVNTPESHPRRGIGRTEVLVVAAIMLLLACIVLPLVYQARLKSRQQQIADRLRSVGVHLHAYHDTFNSFPPGVHPPPRERPKLPPGVKPRDR